MEPNNFFKIAENFIAFQTFLIVIVVPIFCALCISLFHRFIFAKEFFSIFSSLVVVFSISHWCYFFWKEDLSMLS